MSKTDAELAQFVSAGGIGARHPAAPELTVLAGPATADQHNTVRANIIPIACWRLDDIRFEFDSSFVVPEVEQELTALAGLIRDHPPASKSAGKPGFPLSVFGHADPVGNDDYNKQLSGRRATAIYALITRDTNLWEKLFSQPFGNDKWGRRSLEVMLDRVSPASAGKANQDKAAQLERDAGKRKDLFAQYMDTLCGPDLKVAKTDFLAHGDDKGGKGDFQGCSEFNPVLIFSQKDQSRFDRDKDTSARNKANAPNRRVTVLIFRKGSRVNPSKWPCPRVNEGVAACRKRLWSDAEARRGKRLPDKPRKFEETRDTFACRFYDRLAHDSPCERILRTFRIRLFDRFAKPIPGAPFITLVGGRESSPGKADAKGDIVLHDVEVPSIVKIRWSRPDDQRKPDAGSRPSIEPFEESLRASGATDEEIQRLKEDPPLDDRFEFENDIVVDIEPEPESEQEVTAKRVPQEDQHRLRNMGYASEDEPEENLDAFQRDCEAATGKAVDDVVAELRKRHEDCDPPERRSKA